MNETTTYVLMHNGPDGPVPFYVGEALDASARFERHRRDAADPLNEKEAYCYLREHGITDFWHEVIEGASEAETVRELTLAGVRLYNSNAGIRSTIKKKKDMTFSALNRAAAERVERRSILHSPAQQLSKSAIVQTRIRGDYPTIEQLLAAEWHDAGAAEMIGGDAAKSAERCEYTRIGDTSVYIAYRKKKDITAVARHRDGRVCGLPSCLWWGCPKEALLRVLAEEMNGPYGWQRPYA